MKFVFGGPKRYPHQRRGLKKIIETRGVCALLFDPGLGKTAVAFDYCGVAALKKKTLGSDGVPELRVLVVGPLAAVDTWILQSAQWLSPQVAIWAEVLGGSLKERAEALAARGENPMLVKGTRTTRADLSDRMLHVKKSPLTYARQATHGREPSVKSPTRISELGPTPRVILLSTNLDTFSRRDRHGSGTIADVMKKAVARYAPDLIIIDESHKIKGVNSNVSRLLGRIGELVPRRLLLTGTVMPHSPMDVFAQWRFLQPTAFGDFDHTTGERQRATFGGFQGRYGIMGGFMGRQVVKYHRLDELQDIMAENAVVATKEEELPDLPKATPVEVPVELTPAERRAYTEMKKELVAEFSADENPNGSGKVFASAGNRLTQVLRLRQITAGFLKGDGGELMDLGGSMVKMIASIANDTLIGESRVVVFGHFRHEIDAMAAALKHKGTEVLVIDGRTPGAERLAIRQRFGSTDPARLILIAQYATISLSVNELVTASNAIFGTIPSQRDELIQAQDRLNRIGQTRPVTFWFPLALGTIDSVVLESHQKRTNLERAVLDHIYAQN